MPQFQITVSAKYTTRFTALYPKISLEAKDFSVYYISKNSLCTFYFKPIDCAAPRLNISPLGEFVQ